MLRYFREDEVKQLVEPGQAISAVRAAFARDFRKTLQMPVRMHLELGGGILLLMPCHDKELNLAGVKTVPVGAQAGVSATYTPVDTSTGNLLAILAANNLTACATAPTS